MNAKEMFEKLGYKRIKGNGYIEYGSQKGFTINFWLDLKAYDVDECPTKIDLHQAITQQMKELGWL